MAELTDSDSENVSAVKSHSARKNVTDADSSSVNSQTQKGKAGDSEPIGIRSTRRRSTWEAEESKTLTSTRSRKVKTPSEGKDNAQGEVEDLLSPLESRTPLSKRKRGKSHQPQEDTSKEPKTPSSIRSKKPMPQTSSEVKLNSESEVEDSKTPSSKRMRAKTSLPQEDTDDLMSPVESKTPLALRTPTRTTRSEKTPLKTPKTALKTPSKSPRTPKAKPSSKTPSKVINKNSSSFFYLCFMHVF